MGIFEDDLNNYDRTYETKQTPKLWFVFHSRTQKPDPYVYGKLCATEPSMKVEVKLSGTKRRMTKRKMKKIPIFRDVCVYFDGSMGTQHSAYHLGKLVRLYGGTQRYDSHSF